MGARLWGKLPLGFDWSEISESCHDMHGQSGAGRGHARLGHVKGKCGAKEVHHVLFILIGWITLFGMPFFVGVDSGYSKNRQQGDGHFIPSSSY